VFVQRLFPTSAGAMYMEADYDGVRAVVFGDDGRVAEAADLASAGLQASAIETTLRDDLKLGEVDSRRLAGEIRTALDEEGDNEDFPLWQLAVVMLGTVGIWLLGAAAIVAGIVYLVLRLT
jgi:hypothetical protein